MKAFLCSSDGMTTFALMPKLTTIGRENCDIIIMNNSLDLQHAVIEYDQDDLYFSIHDLNSMNGTYVNEKRLASNTTLPLNDQHSIRFAFCNQNFFLVSEEKIQFQSRNMQPQQQIKQIQTISQIPPIALHRQLSINQPTMINSTQQKTSARCLYPVPATAAAAGTGVLNSFWLPHPHPTQDSSSFSSQSNHNNSSSSSSSSSSAAYIQTTISHVQKPPIAAGKSRHSSGRGTPPPPPPPPTQARPLSSQSAAAAAASASASATHNNRRNSSNDLVNEMLRQQSVNSQTKYRRQQQIEDRDRGGGVVGGCCCLDLEFERKLLLEIEDRLALEKELADKERTIENMNAEIKELHVELQHVKRDKTTATGLVDALKSDLANKNSINKKQTKQFDEVRKELNEKEKCIIALEEERLNEKKKKKKNPLNEEEEEEVRLQKEKELLSNVKFQLKCSEEKISELSGQVERVKEALQTSQSHLEANAKNERHLRDEIEYSKRQFEDIQRAERTVQVELKKMQHDYSLFRSKVIQAVSKSVAVKEDSSSEEIKMIPSDSELFEAITTQFEIFVAQSEKLLNEEGNVKVLNENFGTAIQNHWDLIDSLSKLNGKIIDVENLVVAAAAAADNDNNNNKRMMPPFEEEEEEKISIILSNFKVDESLLALRDTLIKQYERFSNWHIYVANEKETLNSEILSLKSLNYDVNQQMHTFKEEQIEQDKVKYREVHLTYENNEKLLLEKHTLELETINNNKSEDMKMEIGSYDERVKILADELRCTKEQLTNLASVCEGNVQTIEIEFEKRKGECEQRMIEAELNLKNTENNYNIELCIHKEQIRQHALTIVKFEAEIFRYKEMEIYLQEQLQTLHQNPESQKEEKTLIESSTSLQSSSSQLTYENQRIAHEMTLRIETLSLECEQYKGRLCEQDDVVRGLRRDLAGASAKLSDTNGGQMGEKQKRELERNRQLVIEQQKEMSGCRGQLAKLSEIVEKQTERLEQAAPELAKAESLSEKHRLSSEENGLLAVELKMKLERLEGEMVQFGLVQCEEGKMTNELAAAGAQCRGERHEQVITRQREALNELRQKYKLLEQSRPPSSTTSAATTTTTTNQQQQQQQQVMLLKKQLAEVRASHALNEDVIKHVNLARAGQDPDTHFIIEEKTAHYETQTALESSEESYLTLLKTIGSILGTIELDGLRSMVNLPFDERLQLNIERSKSIETLSMRIKGLIEKLSRKEDLLKDYEIDLAKLRQAEFLLDKKSEQLEESHLYCRTKDDEIDCLSQALKTAKTEIVQGRNIISAAKKCKNVGGPFPPPGPPIHVGSARRPSTDTLHHHCRDPSDTTTNRHHQAAAAKKAMHEKMKRKDYELKTLKKEICEKSREQRAANSHHHHHITSHPSTSSLHHLTSSS